MSGKGVEGYRGGVSVGVLKDAVIICSKNVSNCFKERALCRVSSGRMGGTPPNPSKYKYWKNIQIEINSELNVWENVTYRKKKQASYLSD